MEQLKDEVKDNPKSDRAKESARLMPRRGVLGQCDPPRNILPGPRNHAQELVWQQEQAVVERENSLTALWIAVAVLVVLMLLLLTACDSGTPNDPGISTIGTPQGNQNFNGTIKIGVAAPLSGDTADGGIQIVQGVQLAAQEINDKGGLLGKRVEVVLKDDKANADAGKKVASELVVEKVSAVVGHKDSGVSDAAAPIYEAAGIVQISPTSSRPDLTTKGLDNFLRTCPNDSFQGPYLADYVVNKLGKKKIAIINGNTPYGKGLREFYERKLAELNVVPVAAVEIERGGLDFTSALRQVKAAQPEVVMYAGSIPEAIIVTRQMHDEAITETYIPDAIFVAGDTVFQRDFIKSTGKASEGAIISSFFTDTVKVGSLRPWVNSYRTLFQRDPGGNSAGGYTAAQVVFEAIRKANSDDPAAVLTAAKSVQLSDSLIGPISFNQQGDLADPGPHLHLFRVEGGQFVPLGN